MKLYVAGPMTGLEQNNYPAFRTAARTLRAAGYAVMDPSSVDEVHAEENRHAGKECTTCATGVHSWEWYMKIAMGMMLQCDGVACLPNWHHSRGARMEVELARTLGMPVESHTTWVLNREDFQKQWDKMGTVYMDNGHHHE